jgi:hypothetical protein
MAGLAKCSNLEVVEFRNILRHIEVTEAPESLSEIIFTNCGQSVVSKDLIGRGIIVENAFRATG